MKRAILALSVFSAALVWAGIPPSEGGLKAPNDSSVIPRALAITDGGSLVTNVDLVATRNPAQFNIPGTPALSVQCPDAGAWIYTDVTTVGPGTGVMVPAGGFYTTGCAKQLSLLQNDGGQYLGCVIAMSPLAGATGNMCIVHVLRGTP